VADTTGRLAAETRGCTLQSHSTKSHPPNPPDEIPYSQISCQT